MRSTTTSGTELMKSRIHLPAPLQTLMIEDESPIIDFYPDDFEIDMNGKKMAWQGVALLPFIDQTRLLAALKSKETELTDDEKRRNRWGDNVMFVSEGNRLFETFCGLYTLKAGQKVRSLRLQHDVPTHCHQSISNANSSHSSSTRSSPSVLPDPSSPTQIAFPTAATTRPCPKSKNAQI